jgi:DNA-binding protein HU-beta
MAKAPAKTVISKQDLIDAVAGACGITKDSAKTAVDTMLAHIKDGMKKGEDVRIADFGTFKATKRPAREGRNPSTGKTIQIPASVVPKFQPAKGLKEHLN